MKLAEFNKYSIIINFFYSVGGSHQSSQDAQTNDGSDGKWLTL